jgi:UPF0755 protein
MRDDTARSHPYNTYAVMGLPPGPIAIPSRAAIEAARNPLETDDIFFVATGTGGHNFSKTLAEHNRNVNAYRAAVAKSRQTAPKPPAKVAAKTPAAKAPLTAKSQPKTQAKTPAKTMAKAPQKAQPKVPAKVPARAPVRTAPKKKK